MIVKTKPLRIAIDAQLPENSGSGGCESVLIGLIRSLGHLMDGPEEYVIIGLPENHEWLRQYLGPNQKLIPFPSGSTHGISGLIPKPIRPAARYLRNKLSTRDNSVNRTALLSVSNGFYEGLNCDVAHFPYGYFVTCALPTIFNVHDLEHLNNPQFCTPATIAQREYAYPIGCRVAKTVVVATQWIKDDIIRHYGTSADKIRHISWSMPTQAYPAPTEEQILRVKSKYKLPETFTFYPALTAPHKNHIRLLKALAVLREHKGLRTQLVCTGFQDFEGSTWPEIQATIKELRLENQVQFLGLVPTQDMRPIYRLAQSVILPPLTQALSGPQAEAWIEDLPVACSDIPSLRKAGGEGAIFFNPYSVESIAKTIEQISTDDSLRVKLRQAGMNQLKKYHISWERTAKSYRALYRQVSGHPLTDEDSCLLKVEERAS